MTETVTAPAPVGKRPYEAWGAARELWTCKADEILIEGPAGTGKTRGILEKMHFCAMKYPQYRGAILRKTRESMTNTVLVTFEEKVVQPKSSILKGPRRNLRQTYYYPNGSQIDVGGLDKSSKIMSSEYDQIGIFEGTEVAESEFEDLTTRLRNGVMAYQQIIVDCNPGAPRHWLNKRPTKSGMIRLLSRHEDNPVLYDMKAKVWTEAGKKYIAKLDRLTGARRLRLRFGKWAEAEGVVYEEYDAEKHIINRVPIQRHWRKIRVVDFGYVNPFVCQWWAIDNDGNMLRYREVYFSYRTVNDHASTINRLSVGETYEATVCDHDSEDRATLESHGIHSVPAYKDILRGIQSVKERLVPTSGPKEPRLFYLRDSLVEFDEELDKKGHPVKTEDEFDAYVYRKSEEGKPLKEEPVDKDNHGLDATRYAVAYFDGLATYQVRIEGDEAVAVEV